MLLIYPLNLLTEEMNCDRLGPSSNASELVDPITGYKVLYDSPCCSSDVGVEHIHEYRSVSDTCHVFVLVSTSVVDLN